MIVDPDRYNRMRAEMKRAAQLSSQIANLEKVLESLRAELVKLNKSWTPPSNKQESNWNYVNTVDVDLNNLSKIFSLNGRTEAPR